MDSRTVEALNLLVDPKTSVGDRVISAARVRSYIDHIYERAVDNAARVSLAAEAVTELETLANQLSVLRSQEALHKAAAYREAAEILKRALSVNYTETTRGSADD